MVLVARRRARLARRRRRRAVREPDRGRRRRDLLAVGRAGPRPAEALDVFRVRDSIGPPGDRRGALDEGAPGPGVGRHRRGQGGDPGGRRARAPSRSASWKTPGRADRVQDRQQRQPRLLHRRGDHRGSPRRAVRHHAHAFRRRASTSTARRSRPRPTAPSTCSTCATRRRWTRSSTPNGRRACARRCSRCSLASNRRSSRAAPSQGPSHHAVRVPDVARCCRWPRGPARRRCWRRVRSCSARATSRARSRRSTRRPRSIPRTRARPT